MTTAGDLRKLLSDPGIADETPVVVDDGSYFKVSDIGFYTQKAIHTPKFGYEQDFDEPDQMAMPGAVKKTVLVVVVER